MNGPSRIAGVIALGVCGCICSCGGGGASGTTGPTPAPVFAVQLGAQNALLTTAQRAAFGQLNGPPDGSLGVYLNGGTYTFFGAARSATANCAGTPAVQGTYRLGGSLTSLTAPYGCTASLTPGNDPNGYTFDRDYAGGGPVLPVTSAGGTAGLLHIYHGEYHAGTCSGLGSCFYASLGMALSLNGGATFTKLGEIVQPYVTRGSVLNANTNLDVGGGTLIVADQNGGHIANLAAANPANVFLYVFYTDNDPAAAAAKPCSTYSCIAVARAQLSTVVTAAFAGNMAAFPTLFQKYYQGGWTQPGTSSDPNAATNAGHYTPVFADVGSFPSVVYDGATQQFVMAYTTGNNAVVMRYGPNLLAWSSPVASGAISGAGGSILYTTLVGETADPTVANGNPYLFYITAPMWPDWPEAVVVNRQLHLSYQ